MFAAVGAAAVMSRMVAAANLVEVAALVGDTARATILAALTDGRALTGSELACLAHISRPTASEYLSKLVKARLVEVTKKRRYRYYRIASPLVASMLESIKAAAAIEVPPRHQPRSAEDDALRLAPKFGTDLSAKPGRRIFCRPCLDWSERRYHLAGRVGAAICRHCLDIAG